MLVYATTMLIFRMYVCRYVCVCMYVWGNRCRTSRRCAWNTVALRCPAAFGRFGRPAVWMTLCWSRCCGSADDGFRPCIAWLCGCLLYVCVCSVVWMYVCRKWMNVCMYVCMHACTVCSIWMIVCMWNMNVCMLTLYFHCSNRKDIIIHTNIHTYIHTSDCYLTQAYDTVHIGQSDGAFPPKKSSIS